MCLVKMVYVVLLLVESLLSVLLIFENLCQNAFSALRLTVMVDGCTVSLNTHSSSMYGIKLVLNGVAGPWRSLPSRRSWRIITAGYRWSWDINLCSWARYQILGLIATRLDHKTLLLCSRHIIIYRTGIYWLPSVFSVHSISMLNHSTNHGLITICSISIILSSNILLVH